MITPRRGAARRTLPRIARATLLAEAILVTAGTGAAGAAKLTFGASLNTVPTRDTANGWDTAGNAPAPRYAAIRIPAGTETHAAEDLTVWNTRLASGEAAAPARGQILEVRLKGCAIEEDGRTGYDGIPSNMILFQAMTPNGNGSYTAYGSPAGKFYLPWCSHSSDPSRGAVSTSTVTTFRPVKECIDAGGLLALRDIGGFIPASGSNPDYYGNGVPLVVLGRTRGSATQSYVGNPQPTVLGPSAPSGSGYGFGSEGGQELEMQMVEGTGDDAFVGCPGGHRPAAGQPPRLANLTLRRGWVRRGTPLVVDYTDTWPGLTTLRAFKDFFGRRSGNRCVTRPTRTEHHDPVCHFWRRVTAFRHHDAMGANRVRLATSRLAAGTYQLKLVTRIHGQSSGRLVKTFHILANP